MVTASDADWKRHQSQIQVDNVDSFADLFHGTRSSDWAGSATFRRTMHAGACFRLHGGGIKCKSSETETTRLSDPVHKPHHSTKLVSFRY